MRGHLTPGEPWRYLIALGSNVRHRRLGAPPRVLAAAMDWLDHRLGRVVAHSRIIGSAPIGPSQRRYANAALVLASHLEPEDLLRRLKDIERQFGRRERGQPWRARVLDLDVVMWSGGAWASEELVIPHPAFRRRPFVLAPASMVAPAWRDPLTGLTVRQLRTRLTRANPVA